MKISPILILFPCILINLLSCSTVPQQGVVLSNSITAGLSRLQETNEKAIRTLADIERSVLAKNWQLLYAELERQYQIEHSLLGDSALGQKDRRAIAELVGNLKKQILTDIATAESMLILQSRKNADQVVNINTEVQNYLLSIHELSTSEHAINTSLQQITTFDFSNLIGIVDSRLAGLRETPGAS